MFPRKPENPVWAIAAEHMKRNTPKIASTPTTARLRSLRLSFRLIMFTVCALLHFGTCPAPIDGVASQVPGQPGKVPNNLTCQQNLAGILGRSVISQLNTNVNKKNNK